jgi:hypothetical protein
MHPDAVRAELPVAPGPLAQNATNAQIAIRANEDDKFKAVQVGMRQLKELLSVAIGPVIRDDMDLAHPGGIASMTLQDMLLFLEARHSTVTNADLNMLIQSLSTKFDSVATFRADIARMAKTYRTLERCNQAFPEKHKTDALAAAVEHDLALSTCAAAYYKHVLDPSLRTFTDMHEFIRVRATNVQITAAKAGYAAATTIVASVPPEELSAQVRSLADTVASLAAAIQRPPERGGRTGRGGREQRTSGRGRGRGAVAIEVRKYCFEHGFGSHAGAECTVMQNDSSYTANMKNATAPCVIDNYQGSVRTK